MDNLYTTRINETELLYGAFNSMKVEQNLTKISAFLANFKILEFDEKASFVFAQEKARLKKLGVMIADMDLMIASITVANGYALVSNNLKHFERIEGLKVEQWLGN